MSRNDNIKKVFSYCADNNFNSVDLNKYLNNEAGIYKLNPNDVFNINIHLYPDFSSLLVLDEDFYSRFIDFNGYKTSPRNLKKHIITINNVYNKLLETTDEKEIQKYYDVLRKNHVLGVNCFVFLSKSYMNKKISSLKMWNYGVVFVKNHPSSVKMNMNGNEKCLYRQIDNKEYTLEDYFYQLNRYVNFDLSADDFERLLKIFLIANFSK